jgi:hypothetical protein
MAFHRPAWYESTLMRTMSLQATVTENNVLRWHGMQSFEKETDVSNPDELNNLDGYAYKHAPNILFYVKTTEMYASLEGTVTNQNSYKLDGAQIVID